MAERSKEEVGEKALGEAIKIMARFLEWGVGGEGGRALRFVYVMTARSGKKRQGLVQGVGARSLNCVCR